MAPQVYDTVNTLMSGGDKELLDPMPKNDFIMVDKFQRGSSAVEDWGAVSLRVRWKGGFALYRVGPKHFCFVGICCIGRSRRRRRQSQRPHEAYRFNLGPILVTWLNHVIPEAAANLITLIFGLGHPKKKIPINTALTLPLPDFVFADPNLKSGQTIICLRYHMVSSHKSIVN